MNDDVEAGMRDERNLLVEVIADVSRALRPRTIVVENVPQFLTKKVKHPDTGHPISAASLLTSRLQEEYAVFPLLTDLADYGVPQRRRRAFLTFIHRDEPGLYSLIDLGRAPYPAPTHVKTSGKFSHVSMERALQRAALPGLDARTAESAYAPGYNGLHSVPVWNDRRYPMIAAITPGTGSSAWTNDQCELCGPRLVGAEDAACPDCGAALLRPVLVREDGSLRLVNGFRRSSYRRMDPNRPAATITTASGRIGSDLTIHPTENRVLSPLECAILQTFPSDFEWGGSSPRGGASHIREMIGEAVPPRFTKRHGDVLRELLQGRIRMDTISTSDPRYRAAVRRLGLRLAVEEHEN